MQFGAATPFVAAGGWVGSWELSQDPFQLMQDRWRCISYDHRGSGASSFPTASLTPDALVDDLFYSGKRIDRVPEYRAHTDNYPTARSC